MWPTILAGVLGGFVALGVTVLVLAVRYQQPREDGYMNPSAAVGESLATLLWAAVIFAGGVCCGVIVAVLRRNQRNPP